MFGASESAEGDPLYERARALGGALVAGGFDVINGGYGGVMEAASRGAHEAGGRAVGVGCTIFSARTTNPWLVEVIESTDLYERTRELIDRSHGCVVLDGKSGTLAEMSWIWALHRARSVGDYPVVLLSDAWTRVFRTLVEVDSIDPERRALTHCVDDPDAVEEAVRILHRELTECP